MVDRKNEFISRKGLLDAICEGKGKQEMESRRWVLMCIRSELCVKCDRGTAICQHAALKVAVFCFHFLLFKMYTLCATLPRDLIFLFGCIISSTKRIFFCHYSFVCVQKITKKLIEFCIFLIKRMGNIARHNLWNSGSDQHHKMEENWYLANSIMGRQSRNTIQWQILAPPQLKADAVPAGRRRCLGDGLPPGFPYFVSCFWTKTVVLEKILQDIIWSVANDHRILIKIVLLFSLKVPSYTRFEIFIFHPRLQRSIPAWLIV